jgi:hypothetical protein
MTNEAYALECIEAHTPTESAHHAALSAYYRKLDAGMSPGAALRAAAADGATAWFAVEGLELAAEEYGTERP